MDNTTSNYTEDEYHLETALYAEHIWMIITSILNIIANVLILVTMYRIRTKSSVYRFICFLSATDIFSHFFAESTFELLGTIHEILQDFRIRTYLTCLYFTGQNCGVLVLIAMVLRNHVSFVEKFHIFVMMAICITGVVYFSVLCLVAHYVVLDYLYFSFAFMCLLLLLTTFVEQIIHTVHLEKPIPSENRLLSAMAVIFISIRLLFTIVVFLAAIITRGNSEILSALGIILISFIDFNSIVNIILLVKNDVNFKMKLYEMLRLNSLIQNNPVKFVNMSDENVNMLVDG